MKRRREAKRREEEKRRGLAADQVAKREALAKLRTEKNEQVQRQQWGPAATKKQAKEDNYLSKAPKPMRDKLTKISSTEEQQRTNFLHDVEGWSEDKDKNQPQQVQQQNSVAPPPALNIQPKTPSTPPTPPVPTVPHKN